MPKLERNTNGEYYTRYSKNGTIFTIHFDNNIISYMNRKHIKIGDELPYSWRSDTMKWQYSHGVSAKKAIVSGLVNAKCPICGKPVFYYENEYGSKVYFDHAGDDWPKHPCTNNTYAHNSSLSKVNNLKIKFYNKNAIILVDEWKQYFMVSNFYLNKDKSMYTFYILKESDAPSKLIAIDNIAREFKIIKYGKDDETMFYNKIDLKNIHQDLSALYEAAEVFANTSAKFDALITRLAATIIYYTMATCDRQQGKTSNEANILLNFMQSKKPHEAQFLRTFLVEYGPFSISLKPSQVLMKGKPPLIVENSVKFSQKKFDNMGLSADDAAIRAMDCTFIEWKRKSTGKDNETIFYNNIDLKNIDLKNIHQELSVLYDYAEVFANTSAKFDALITRLAATIIYYTMATCDCQQGKTSREANILLNFMQVQRPHEAQFLRTFLVEYGPFSISKSSQLMIKGRPPLIVKNSVKFSQVKFNNMGLSATEAAKRVMDCTFTEWKRNSIREAANYFKNIK